MAASAGSGGMPSLFFRRSNQTGGDLATEKFPRKASGSSPLRQKKAWPRKDGHKAKLEDAGVRIMAQTCLVISPAGGRLQEADNRLGNLHNYLPSRHSIDIRYAETEKCVEAVT